MTHPVIAVDGGAASGKGAVASKLAEALGFHYLDSGVYYRALGFQTILHKISMEGSHSPEKQLSSLAESLQLTFTDDRIWLSNDSGLIDITTAIRTEEASIMSSKVSQFPSVRTALMRAQRNALTSPGLVAEGRDMGTVVFPDAAIKLFLTCDLEERAKRRVLQLENQGISANIDEVRRAIAERDYRDTHRAVAPLQSAADAVVIDSTHQTLFDVVQQCIHLCQQALPPRI